MAEGDDSELIPPSGAPDGKYSRATLNALGGLIPFVGGVFSAAAGMWSESEQEKLKRFFKHWLEMLQAEANVRAPDLCVEKAQPDHGPRAAN